MKIVKKIAIVLLVIFFCFISFLSFLFLSRNKYGVIDIGSNLYVTISEDNKSDVFDNGSLVVVEKKDFSKLKANDNIFVYTNTEDQKKVRILSTVIKEVDYEKKNIMTEDTSEYYSDEFILGVPVKSYDKLGGVIDLMMSKWFFFFVFLLPGFFIVLYEVYTLIIKIKFDDEFESTASEVKEVKDIPVATVKVTDNDELERLKKELESVKEKVLSRETEKQEEVSAEKDVDVPVEDVTDNSVDVDDSLTLDVKNLEETSKEKHDEVSDDDIEVLDEIEGTIVIDGDNGNEELKCNMKNVPDTPSESLVHENNDTVKDANTETSNNSDTDISKVSVSDDNIETIATTVEEEVLDKNVTEEKKVTSEEFAEEPVIISSEVVDDVLTVSKDDPLCEELEIDNPRKVNIIGKNENNIIRKGLLLIESEVKELLLILSCTGEQTNYYTSIVNKIVDTYIEDKYFGESYTTGNMKYNAALIKNYKVVNISNSSMILAEIKRNLQIVNDILDNGLTDLDTYLKNINEDIRGDIENRIVKVYNKYKEILYNYLDNINSSDFLLCEEIIIKNKVKSTYVKCEAKFDKIFSEYAIEKSLKNNIVNENIDELQLKMMSFRIFSNMIKRENVNYKYLYYFKESFFKKPKKINSLLRDIDDSYSQERILIAIKYDILSKNLAQIKEFKNKGYRFAVEISEKDIDKIDKDILLCVDMIFIITEETNKELYYSYVPFNMISNLYLSKKTILYGEII